MCSLPTTRVGLQECKWCILVSTVIVEVILITEDMVVLLICNHLQSQDASTQTDVSENRITSDNLPSLGLPENSQVMRIVPAISLMPQSSDLEQSTRAVSDVYLMAGVSYLPWILGVLEEHLGEGYWLLFTQRLPIFYKVGDHLYGLMH